MPFPRLPLLASAILLAACSATSTQHMPIPAPDSAVAPSAARVYVTRADKLAGSVREVRIYDNEQPVGVLTEDGYLMWDRPTERGTCRAVFEGYLLDGGEVESIFDLPREGGSTTYILLRLERHDRKPVAETLSPADGRALIAKRSAPRQD